MTQEDKELLLKDLCARLPYGVKAMECEDEPPFTIDSYDKADFIDGDNWIDSDGWNHNIAKTKPYLFPMSSMTEEQCDELYAISELQLAFSPDMRIKVYKNTIEWFLKNHIDYNGLIPKGLALDATGKNIY